jgi:hypothetical protein
MIRNLRVSQDVADAFTQIGLGTAGRQRRSALSEILSNSPEVATTVIALLQVPLTIQQLREVLRIWRRSRSARHTGGLLRISSPTGELECRITSETELEEVLPSIHRLLWPAVGLDPEDEDDD